MSSRAVRVLALALPHNVGRFCCGAALPRTTARHRRVHAFIADASALRPAPLKIGGRVTPAKNPDGAAPYRFQWRRATLPEASPFSLFDRHTPVADQGWRPQVVVIGLGTNDFSTPLNPGEKWTTRDELHADFEATYVSFVQTLRARLPDADRANNLAPRRFVRDETPHHRDTPPRPPCGKPEDDFPSAMPLPSLRVAFRGAAFVISLLGVGWCGESAPQPPPLAGASVAPELAAAAERENLRLFHADLLGDEQGSTDAIVLWIGTARATERTQWLVALRRAHATPKELAAHRPKKVTRYLPWGSEVVFESDADAIDLWIAGPVDVSATRATPTKTAPFPHIRRTRVYLPKTILQMGLDDTVRAQRFINRRIEEIKQQDPAFNGDHVFALHKPLDAGTVNWAKPRAARMGMTPDIERTWVGGWVALQAIYDCLHAQPDLRNMIEVAFDKPPVWRLAKMAFGTVFHTGIDGVNAKPLDPAQVGLPPVPLECLEVPFFFSFDHKAISQGALVVTTPKPPLDLSAGILGAVAVHPKDPTRKVQVSVISLTRNSPPAVAAGDSTR